MPRVVIVGAGFGGLAAARALADAPVDVVVVDRNNFQQNASTAEIMPSLEPLADKWRAFDWDVREIEGNNLELVLSSLRELKSAHDKPQCLIAHTVKGYGVHYLADNPANAHFHGIPLPKDQLAQALKDIDDMP